MVDLSGYQDLTKPPVGAGNGQAATLPKDEDYSLEMEYSKMSSASTSYSNPGYATRPEMTEADLKFMANIAAM